MVPLSSSVAVTITIPHWIYSNYSTLDKHKQLLALSPVDSDHGIFTSSGHGQAYQ